MSHLADGDFHAYLDGALDAYAPAEAERIRAHLESCPECARRLEQERELRGQAASILDAADPGSVPLASLQELEARAEATTPGRDTDRQTRPSWRSPSMIGMGWAASIALALWAGYSVKDFAPNPAARGPVVLEPARPVNAVSANEQATEREDQAAEAPALELDRANDGLVRDAFQKRAAGAGAAGEAAPESDPDLKLGDALRQDVAAVKVTEAAGRQAEEPEAAAQQDSNEARLRRDRLAREAVSPPAVPPRLLLDSIEVTGARREARSELAAVSGAVVVAPTDVALQEIAVRGVSSSISRSVAPAVIPELEIRREDLEELPGLGRAMYVVQGLPNGDPLELWSFPVADPTAEASAANEEARLERLTTHFEASLPRGWSMVVLMRPAGFVVARAPLSETELHALLESLR